MNGWRERRVLVTGAGGLLGANLTIELVRRGALVVALQQVGVKSPAIGWLGVQSHIITHVGDICSLPDVMDVLNRHAVSDCFHFGAQTLRSVAFARPFSTFETNVRGTYTVLEACRKAGTVQTVVVASSAGVLGSAIEAPSNEEPRNTGLQPYEASKACVEVIANSYWATYDMAIGVSRCTNLFGPADRNFSRLVPNAIRSALEGRQFEWRDPNDVYLDLLSVKDAVRGHLLLAEALRSGVVKGKTLDFAGGLAFSAQEVVGAIYAIVNRNSDASGQVQLHPIDSAINTRETTQLLSWKPGTEFERALRETVAWYAAHPEVLTRR